jgi:predicted transcriptional regulator
VPRSTDNAELRDRIYRIIRDNPGIRPREIHRQLGIAHSGHLRDSLIRDGLVRKEKRGNAVHYYPVA